MYLFLNLKFSSKLSLLNNNQTRRSLAQYIINQNGEKVVVSKRVNIRTKREEWQKTDVMEYDKVLKKIRQIEWDERLQCDPEQARQISENKFQNLANRLQSTGLCRDIYKPYQPPENTKQIIDELCQTILNGSKNFSNSVEKFNFLIECQERFNHEVMNSELYRINTVDDVYQYYMTPVRGNSKYNVWAYDKSSIPSNLNLIPEPLRFNAKTDTFFDGVNAFPGSTPQVMGLRARKKYPQMEENFVWPDV